MAIYKLAENVAMCRAGTLTLLGGRAQDPPEHMGAPFYLVITGPLLEHALFRWEGGYVSWVLGAACFAAATFFRTKGHLDLRKGFSTAIEVVQEAQLVQRGRYRRIRHPLYMGNLCLFVACPLFLAARISWAFTLLGFIGVLARIRIEERFLREHLEGYAAYMEKTWALIPGVY